jgi:hypothetical protein
MAGFYFVANLTDETRVSPHEKSAVYRFFLKSTDLAQISRYKCATLHDANLRSPSVGDTVFVTANLPNNSVFDKGIDTACIIGSTRDDGAPTFNVCGYHTTIDTVPQNLLDIALLRPTGERFNYQQLNLNTSSFIVIKFY